MVRKLGVVMATVLFAVGCSEKPRGPTPEERRIEEGLARIQAANERARMEAEAAERAMVVEGIHSGGFGRLDVPTDPRADYTALSVKRTSAARRVIVTKREGPSGTSFSKREVDCRAMTFRYLGDGDTIGEMESSRSSPQMGPLVAGSISYYVSRFACDN